LREGSFPSRIAVVKFKGAILAAMQSVALISPGVVEAVDPDLARFASAKQNQIREYEKELTNKVPSMVWSLFEAVRVDDWETATNLEARLNRASGRFPDNTDRAPAPALKTLVWPCISEVIGAYEDFHLWNNKLLHRFGGEIISSIPKESIYFGGTDPGRFLISALSESHREGKPFFTITQNQLADGTYLAYLRKMYGNRIYIPSADDSQKAFEEYLKDAKQRMEAGKLRPGEDVRIVDERVQVSGQVAVMQINGLLAKMILNKNSGRRFFIEESYALDWMYPHLTPSGLIFELHPQPLGRLSRETIEKDMAYWKKLTGELIGDWFDNNTSVEKVCDFADRVFLQKNLSGFKGDAAFAKNEEAQKCFSKLRSSIGGLYVWRSENGNDTEEKNQAQSNADLAFRQAYALCPYSPEVVFRYANLLENLRRHDDAVLMVKTSVRLSPDSKDFRDLLRSLTRR
jgi:hypothetical protein